jgi:hypothetical protein
MIWAVKKKSKKEIEWPPTIHMKNIGGKCPDYWTYLGEDSNNNTICQNVFNIPTNPMETDTNKCSIEVKPDIHIKKFKNYSSWPPKGTSLSDRCEWINKCGQKNGITGSWIGLDKICSDIPTSE